MKTTRKVELVPKIVMVDGLPGCGKTMISRIVSSFDRVEKLTYALKMELVCQLWFLGKLDSETAQTMIRIHTDMSLYDLMMSRETNFRMKELSSVFMDVRPWRYIKRLFEKGEEAIPSKVQEERPILHLTTHQLLSMGRPLFDALGDRLVFIDMVRHPLYMIKQQTLNMEKLVTNVRYFNLHFEYNGQEIPSWAKGWEETFINSNDVEKAIYSIINIGNLIQENKNVLPVEFKDNIITIPFEDFVISPYDYISNIASKLDSAVTPLTSKIMRQQKVPRKKFADGIDLSIYRRCGWQKPEVGNDESGEFAIRRNWVLEQISEKAMNDFDELCKDYERTYMGGEQAVPGR